MAEERNLYTEYLKPAIEYVVGLGEAVVLAVFFRVAADQTHSILLQVFAFIMMLVVGAYAGMPAGLLMRPLNRIKTSKLWLALLITLPLGVCMAAAANIMGRELSDVVRQMANGTGHLANG